MKRYQGLDGQQNPKSLVYSAGSLSKGAFHLDEGTFQLYPENPTSVYNEPLEKEYVIGKEKFTQIQGGHRACVHDLDAVIGDLQTKRRFMNALTLKRETYAEFMARTNCWMIVGVVWCDSGVLTSRTQSYGPDILILSIMAVTFKKRWFGRGLKVVYS